MVIVVAQVAPQRSTQYAALASALAPQELRLSPLGRQISQIRPLQLAGQEYLKFELSEDLAEVQIRELGMMATVSAFFVYYEGAGQIAGPLLRPIETHFRPVLPADLVMVRRYRGKTNELLTHFMCNIARWSSGLAHRPWSELRVFDPLSGGGTTLFTALVLGANVAGIEHRKRVIESTAAFIRQYMRTQGISCQEKTERLRGIGRRWSFTIGEKSQQQCILAHGDTTQSQVMISGFEPQLIVADLPYGIQHQGQLTALLTKALPVWAAMLPSSGAMALAWESTRLPRAEMISLVESVSPLTVLNRPPYNTLTHRVDRVIKQRDILVAQPAE